MRRERAVCALLVLITIPLFSCMSLTNYERTERIRADEPRCAVAFESPQAAEVFEAAVRERWHGDAGRVRTDRFGILLVAAYTKTTTLAENAHYNDQVTACDLNCDGIISEEEAHFYQDRCRCAPSRRKDHRPSPSSEPLLLVPVPLPGEPAGPALPTPDSAR